MKANRLLAIGLDGASWSIIDPLIKEGKLKNISRCIANGNRASLKSTIPYLTPPAWSSIFSGVNPGKHGMFDFISIDEEGKRQIVTARNMHADYIWEMLNGENVLGINIPMIYPIRYSGNAKLVAGFGCPDRKLKFTSDEKLKQEIFDIEPNYEIDIPDMDLIFKNNRKEVSRRISANLEMKKRVAGHLLKNKEWELGIIVFSAPDWIQHFFMKEFEESEGKSDTKIAKIYESIDEFIGKIDSKIDVIIISDHGFKTVGKKLFLNSYLKDKGYLKLKNEKVLKRIFRRMGITREKIKNLWFVRKLVGSYYVSMKSSEKARKKSSVIKSILPGENMKYEDIDAEKSNAWLFSKEGGIYVKNTDILEKLIDDLYKLNKILGKKAIKKVWKREELYFGSYVQTAPHLLVELNGDIQLEEEIKTNYTENISENERNGNHDLEGIFISCGKNFSTKKDIDTLSVNDITPLILHYFGYELPDNLDGRIPFIFSEDIKAEKKVKKTGTIRKLVKKLKKAC